MKERAVRKIMYGKGMEYSAAAKEIETNFHSWLSFSGIDETEFDRRMENMSYRIEDGINEKNEIEIKIYAGNNEVIEPLICYPCDKKRRGEFFTNALLLLLYIASRYEEKSFNKTVKLFAERLGKEGKIKL